MHDENIRYIFNRGGSSSGKSVSTAQAVVLSVALGEGSALVARKVAVSVKNTVYEEFKTQIRMLHLQSMFQLKENCMLCENGCKIDFTGLDDPEKIKSITGYRWIVMEEATDFDYEDFTQIRFRLRGKRGLQIICNFNPVSEDSWIKTKILDTLDWNTLEADLYGKVKHPETRKVLSKEYSRILGKRTNKERIIANERTGKLEKYPPDTIELHSSYKNNFWVVGSPDGKYGYYDRQTLTNYQWYREHDYNYYRVYALGEWGSIKTGGEFLYAFDSNVHIKQTEYVKDLPVHISIDNNVLPYISVSFYQVADEGMRQFHEICAADPYNTVTQASAMTVGYLREIGYKDIVYLYGDASTKNGNTIDEEKRSFLDKFREGIENEYYVEERIPDSNPSVSMSGEFVNYILAGGFGILFQVDDECKNSIVDYNNAKKDVNGGILKNRIKDKVTGQSYERYGHLTDCLRYIMTQVYKEEYIRFSLRRKRSKIKEDDEDIRYFDGGKKADGNRLIYVIPDCGGRFIVIMCRVHEYIDIDGIIYRGVFDDGVMREAIGRYGMDVGCIFEAGKEMYPVAKRLRESGIEVRIMHKHSDIETHISAHVEFIKRKIRFRNDYEKDSEYSEFMGDMLDYTGKGSDRYSAMNSLASLACYAAKKFSV